VYLAEENLLSKSMIGLLKIDFRTLLT